MLALFLGLTLAVPAATSGTRFELTASGSFAYSALDTHEQFPAGAPIPLSGRWEGGGGGLAIDVFARRLIDDDAAPPLQVFLQRATRVHLDGGGADAAATYPILVDNPVEPAAPFVQPSAHEATGYVDASLEGYPGRWLFLGGGVGFRETARQYDAPFFSPLRRLPPALSRFVRAVPLFVEAGVRWRELRVLAGWSVTPTQLEGSDFSVPFWGGAFAQADLVVRRFVALSSRVTVGDGGATVDASASVWLRRRLGVSAGVGGGHAASADAVSGVVGLQYWVSARLALALAYSPAWERVTPGRYDGTSDSSVRQLLTLTVTMRPR